MTHHMDDAWAEVVRCYGKARVSLVCEEMPTIRPDTVKFMNDTFHILGGQGTNPRQFVSWREAHMASVSGSTASGAL